MQKASLNYSTTDIRNRMYYDEGCFVYLFCDSLDLMHLQSCHNTEQCILLNFRKSTAPFVDGHATSQVLQD